MTLSIEEYLSRLVLKRHAKLHCGATTRSGEPCRNRPAGFPGRRCHLHGGLSTGPRTSEGRERIAAAQRRRWAAWREARVLHETKNRPP